MLTPDQIAELEARCQAATPPPWYADKEDSVFDEYGRCRNEEASISSCIQSDTVEFIAECVDLGADRVFMAAAREDIPALLADRRELLARVEAAERERDAILALAVKESYGGNPPPATPGFFSPLIRGHGPNLCRKFNSREEVAAAIRTAAGLNPKEAP